MAAIKLLGKPESLWIGTTKKTRFKSLLNDISTDVVVIGGGFVGLQTAYFLQKLGLNVVILESRRIVEGVTGNTTAKVTSQHNLIYDYLINNFGEEKALLYGKANQEAIRSIEGAVKRYKIECDFLSTDAYTFAEKDSEIEKIEKEVKAAQRLQLPATFVENSSLNFPEIKGAIKFANQAQFHPRKYLLGLVESFNSKVTIFENTRVLDAEEQKTNCVVMTDKGKVKAKYVVIASNFPVIDKAFYFSRLTFKRSYALGMYIDREVPEGMYINCGSDLHSFRNQKVGSKTMLIVGGQSHKTGQGGDIAERYKKIEQYAKKHFKVKSIEYHWGTQDPVTLDQIPYIGNHTPKSKRVFVATGFGGWGMTHSVVAAKLITNLIDGKKDLLKELYDPNRFKPMTSGFKAIKENINVATHFIGDHLSKKDDSVSLKKGEARVVQKDGEKVAVYKDDKGKTHAVSAICTHMKCVVSWNSGDKSWDCPCHGSRFSFEGKVLHGPAVINLEKKKI